MSYSYNRICIDLQSAANHSGSFEFNDPAERKNKPGVVYAGRGKVRNAYSNGGPNRAEHNHNGTTDRPRRKNNDNKKIIYLIGIIVAALVVCVASIFILKSVFKSNSKANDTQETVSRSSEDKKSKSSAVDAEIAEVLESTEATETTPTSETTKETEPPKTGWQGSDEKGWRYYLTDTIYLNSTWQQISGKWYYFNSNGIMERGCYRDGYWIEKDGVRNSDEPTLEWKENEDGEWIEDNGWYPSNMGVWIDGKYYWFDSDGFWDSDVESPEEAAIIRAAAEEDDDED